MILSFHRRLSAAEAAAARLDTGGDCPTCRTWPDVATVNDWRTDQPPSPWPPSLRCPACGRPAPMTVRYVTDWPAVAPHP